MEIQLDFDKYRFNRKKLNDNVRLKASGSYRDHNVSFVLDGSQESYWIDQRATSWIKMIFRKPIIIDKIEMDFYMKRNEKRNYIFDILTQPMENKDIDPLIDQAYNPIRFSLSNNGQKSCRYNVYNFEFEGYNNELWKAMLENTDDDDLVNNRNYYDDNTDIYHKWTGKRNISYEPTDNLIFIFKYTSSKKNNYAIKNISVYGCYIDDIYVPVKPEAKSI